MKVTIPVWKSYEYVEVFLITQYKDGCVFKTKSIGFAHRDRPKGPEERYASLSTSFASRQGDHRIGSVICLTK